MPPRSDHRTECASIESHHVQAMFIFFRLFPRGRSPLARQGQGDSSQGAHKPPAFTSGLSRAPRAFLAERSSYSTLFIRVKRDLFTADTA